MGDVYWMTAILIIQTIVSVGICAALTIKTESVVEESKNSKKIG
ncbi:hypothetical protein [Fredinandcohnia onubensis]|nr:hypothetical protein [Fredinandcohnia onubensis]